MVASTSPASYLLPTLIHNVENLDWPLDLAIV